MLRTDSTEERKTAFGSSYKEVRKIGILLLLSLYIRLTMKNLIGREYSINSQNGL